MQSITLIKIANFDYGIFFRSFLMKSLKYLY